MTVTADFNLINVRVLSEVEYSVRKNRAGFYPLGFDWIVKCGGEGLRSKDLMTSAKKKSYLSAGASHFILIKDYKDVFSNGTTCMYHTQ